MATAKKKNKAPSPAQLRARRKFLAASKARIKALRAAKRAAGVRVPRKSKANPRKGTRKIVGGQKRQARQAQRLVAEGTHARYPLATKEGREIFKKLMLEYKRGYKLRDAGKDTTASARRIAALDARLEVIRDRVRKGKTAANPRRGMRKSAAMIKRTTLPADAKFKSKFYEETNRYTKQRYRVGAIKAKRAKRKNAEHRDAQHPIHVTDYWQGRKGYKSQWQRAHEGGQRQLFAVKNPKAFSKSTVIGSQLWKALPADEKAALIRQMYQINRAGWQQAQTVKLIQRVTGATKQPATYMASFAKIAHTVPLAVIQKAQAAGDPKIIDEYRKNGHKRANGSNTALAQKRRAEFVGRPSKKIITGYAPKGSGAKGTLAGMGKLKRLKIKGRGWIDFKGVPYLAHSPKKDRIFICGKNYSMQKFKKRNPGGLEDIGEVTHIEYEAIKSQLGDNAPVIYVHEFGEEGGARPHAVINEENLLLLEGGDYYITPEGIHD